MNHKTEVWKQASEVYEEISELSVQQALAHVYGIKNISIEVQKAVITLINSGNQASFFYQENIANKFNFNIHNTVQVGQRLGEYELLELLGQGGMSQVFKAKRINSEPQKLVAIKVFSPKDSSKELLTHFINEQQILSQFSHPSIVDMLHGGKTKDDIVYLVMELIQEAKPIDKYGQQQSLNTKQKINYIYQCATALAYSHDNLIIHRDLKPDNILINCNKQLKIVDFGIAKLINKDMDDSKTTIMALTPSYAAPEQINSEQITVKTDIFSLAIVALTLLTDGAAPLPKDRMVKSCVNDQVHLDNLIKNLKIDKDLKNILMQASQVESTKRYTNMHAFAEDLDNYLGNKPVNATSPSWFYQLSKFAKRRSALFATLMTLLFTITIGFIILTKQYQQTLIAEQKAIEVKNFMLDVFSYADPEENIGQKLSALDLLYLAEQEIKFKSFSDDTVKADILSNIGIALVNLGGFDQGERNLLESLKHNPDNIQSHLKLAQLYLDKSTPEKAQTYFKNSENIINTSPNDYVLEQAELTLLKALNTTYTKDYEQGIELAQSAQLQFERLGNHQGVLKSTRVLTEKIFNLSEDTKPIEICLRVIKSIENKVAPINTELLRLKTSLTWMYTRLGQFNEANDVIDQVIVNLKQTLGNKHPAILDALIQRSNVYSGLGETEKAIADANESYELSINIYGEQSQYAQQGLSMLSRLEFETGQRQLAQEHLQQVHEMSIINYGKDHSMTLNVQIELSNYLAANGDTLAAIENAKTTQIILNETFGKKHPQTIFGNNVLIKLLSTQEVDDEIIQMAVMHNKDTVEVLGINHPQSAYSFFVLGNIYSSADQLDNANTAYIAILDNNLVAANNARYVALTKAISINFVKIKNMEAAIDYANRSFQAAEQIFGKDSNRSLEALYQLMDGLQATKQKPYEEYKAQLLNRVSSGEITDVASIEKINSY